MKSITSHNLLNRIPILSITHKGLSAIKEIVKIAPEEAQWFHTVEPIVYKHSPNEIHLLLSEKLYIPTQNTSAAQVDTTSSMMMDFYRDLQADYEDQETVNQKLTSMTCWCHSHHNMSPNPSGQDDLQFNSFIKLALDQNQKPWQIMLIFNKKDQFYSRIYDPETSIIHEGAPIRVIHDYDFDYIHQAAKTKFKKPKLNFFGAKRFNKQNSWIASHTNISDSVPLTSHYNTESEIFFGQDDDDINESIIVNILENGFTSYNPCDPPVHQFNKRYILNNNALLKLYNSLGRSFDDREIVFFTYFLANKQNRIPDIFLEERFFNKFPSEDQVSTLFKTLLKEMDVTIEKIYDAAKSTLEIVDLPTRKECKEYIIHGGRI